MEGITPEQRAALAAPFPFSALRWRYADGKSGPVVCYVDARAIMDRLDDVFNGDWSFDWTPVLTDMVPVNPKEPNGTKKPIIVSAKGTITAGGVSKSDIGDNANYEPNKAAVSDALKRAAVHFGIGRYLYRMERSSAVLQNGQLAPADATRLEAAHAKLVARLGHAVPADPAEPLRAILRAWYPTATARIDAMTLDEATALISKATPFVKEVKKAA